MAQTRPERLLPDHFWMYSYKVVMCPLKHSHDWEKCIYAHDGEKMRRRHPSKYQAIQCPEARAKRVCPRGEDCPCTHNLYEYWLSPDRFMTCLCELGPSCNRPICFFAHHPAELRPLPEGLCPAANSSGSSRRRAAAASAAAAAAAAAAAQFAGASAAGSSIPATSTSTSSSPSPAVPQGPQAFGLKQLSTGSLASSTGSQGAASDAVAMPSRPSSGSVTGLLQLQQQQQQQQQALAQALQQANIRPGFTALDALSASSAAQSATQPAGTSGLPSSSMTSVGLLDTELLQQQLPARAAAADTNACPSVLILEAPAPLAPGQDIDLAQAAQQFSQLNLSATGVGWLSSPTARGQFNNSNMSLASSGSSTMGMAGLGSDTPLLASAVLDGQQLMHARSLSPVTSPSFSNSSNQAMLRMAGGNGFGASRSGPLSSGALAALGVSAEAQLMAMQASVDEPPEQLSFSLWDLAAAGGSAAQAQTLAALTNSAAQGQLGTLDGFSGFVGGARGQGATAAANVASLASAAADRLLRTQQQQQQMQGSSAMTATLMAEAAHAPGLGSSSSSAETAREARMTLLRAWVNAAAGAAGGAGRSLDGSLQQQEEQLLRNAVSAGGSVSGAGRLSARALRLVAQDLSSVLSAGDVASLLQQLQHVLQHQEQQHQSALYL